MEKQILLFQAGHDRYLLDGGLIRKDKKIGYWPRIQSVNEATREAFLRQGYKAANDSTVLHWLNKMQGRSFSELEEAIKKHLERTERSSAARRNLSWHWNSAPEKIKKYTCGIHRDIDVFPTGFRVCLLLNSGYTFDEQMGFCRRFRREIIQFVLDDLPLRRSAMRKINDLRFYSAQKMTLARTNELYIFFELKQGIQDALEKKEK